MTSISTRSNDGLIATFCNQIATQSQMTFQTQNVPTHQMPFAEWCSPKMPSRNKASHCFTFLVWKREQSTTGIYSLTYAELSTLHPFIWSVWRVNQRLPAIDSYGNAFRHLLQETIECGVLWQLLTFRSIYLGDCVKGTRAAALPVAGWWKFSQWWGTMQTEDRYRFKVKPSMDDLEVLLGTCI